MDTQTHYTTLGLTQSAPPAIIKAVYKALALKYHPDKTIHLSPVERAQSAATFRAVVEAYEVLSTPSSKELYDKAAVQAKVRQQLERIQEERAQQERENESMNITSLRLTLRAWEDMDREVMADFILRAHCQIKIHDYMRKIKDREAEDKGSLNNDCPNVPCDPTDPEAFFNLGQYASSPYDYRTSPRPTSTTRRKDVEMAQAGKNVSRAQTRAEEKARHEQVKKAQREAKAAAVRAEKEKYQRKVDEIAAREAERIAKARAKAGATPKAATTRTCTDSAPSTPASTASKLAASTASKRQVVNPTVAEQKADHDQTSQGDKQTNETKPGRKRHCGKCGKEHATFAEWKVCSVLAGKEAAADGSFFTAV